MSSTALETGTVEVPGRVGTPPSPGVESAGPPLVELIHELRGTVLGMQSLLGRARQDVNRRTVPIRGQMQLDANGNGALKLYEVPQGAVGRLLILSVDIGDPAVTPGTSNDLPIGADGWHAIYAAGGGSGTANQVFQRGNMLDFALSRLDGRVNGLYTLPFVYLYGSELVCPFLQGPEAFWLVFRNDLGGAGPVSNQQILVRGAVLVETPEQ